MALNSPDNEPFPVDSTVTVIKGTTIYKNRKWWFAVLLVNMFGHNKVALYQWQMNEQQGRWKRKNHIAFNFAKDWDAAKPIVDLYMKEGNL